MEPKFSLPWSQNPTTRPRLTSDKFGPRHCGHHFTIPLNNIFPCTSASPRLPFRFFDENMHFISYFRHSKSPNCIILSDLIPLAIFREKTTYEIPHYTFFSSPVILRKRQYVFYRIFNTCYRLSCKYNTAIFMFSRIRWEISEDIFQCRLVTGKSSLQLASFLCASGTNV
jgi:hypothetical protein